MTRVTSARDGGQQGSQQQVERDMRCLLQQYGDADRITVPIRVKSLIAGRFTCSITL